MSSRRKEEILSKSLDELPRDKREKKAKNEKKDKKDSRERKEKKDKHQSKNEKKPEKAKDQPTVKVELSRADAKAIRKVTGISIDGLKIVATVSVKAK